MEEMLKNKINELELKVGEARKELITIIEDKYAYASHIGSVAKEFVVMLAKLEALEELRDDMDE